MHQLEMDAHSQGFAEFLYNMFGGRLITKDQARETMEFFKAQMKRNIESNPYLTREQKDNEISIGKQMRLPNCYNTVTFFVSTPLAVSTLIRYTPAS